MTPTDVCRIVYGAGLTVRADGDSLVLKPAERMTPALRELLVAHKPDLLAFLHEAEQTAAALVEAAMRACRHHGDGPEAKEQMRQACTDTPAHLRADLLAHFRANYSRAGKALP